MTVHPTYSEIAEKFEMEHQTETSQMFGKPCLKTNKKAFVAFSHGAMAFKIGKQEVDLMILKYPGALNWDPSGKNRPMKDWLQLPEEYAEDWGEKTLQALNFVQNL